jgi:sulfofructose kinase
LVTDRIPSILAVGYNAFDVVVPVADFPLPDSKAPVEEILIGGGGPGATAAVAMARLGARVKLVTALTDDLPGRLQREELNQAGVDLSLSPILCGGRSPKAVILVDPRTQERTIFWSRGELPLLDPGLVDRQWLDGVDLLYCDGHECSFAARLADEARKRQIPVVMDAGSVRDGSAELVTRCTDVISSESFAPALTGHADPTEALENLAARGPERVGMTFGSDGLLGLVEGRPTAWPAFQVSVLDTTGAGDAFHAGYAFATARGQSFPDCLEFGAAVAALKCRNWGGRRGLPFPGEAEELIARDQRRPLGPRLRKYPLYQR